MDQVTSVLEFGGKICGIRLSRLTASCRCGRTAAGCEMEGGGVQGRGQLALGGLASGCLFGEDYLCTTGAALKRTCLPVRPPRPNEGTRLRPVYSRGVRHYPPPMVT